MSSMLPDTPISKGTLHYALTVRYRQPFRAALPTWLRWSCSLKRRYSLELLQIFGSKTRKEVYSITSTYSGDPKPKSMPSIS